jgi:hypothetical protein
MSRRPVRAASYRNPTTLDLAQNIAHRLHRELVTLQRIKHTTGALGNLAAVTKLSNTLNRHLGRLLADPIAATQQREDTTP